MWSVAVHMYMCEHYAHVALASRTANLEPLRRARSFEGLDWLEIQWCRPWQRRSLSKGEASVVQVVRIFRFRPKMKKCRELRTVCKMTNFNLAKSVQHSNRSSAHKAQIRRQFRRASFASALPLTTLGKILAWLSCSSRPDNSSSAT